MTRASRETPADPRSIPRRCTAGARRTAQPSATSTEMAEPSPSQQNSIAKQKGVLPRKEQQYFRGVISYPVPRFQQSRVVQQESERQKNGDSEEKSHVFAENIEWKSFVDSILGSSFLVQILSCISQENRTSMQKKIRMSSPPHDEQIHVELIPDTKRKLSRLKIYTGPRLSGTRAFVC